MFSMVLTERPDPQEIRELAAAATAADGIAPFGEQTLLNLDTDPPADVTHVQLADPHGPIGYAQIDRGSAELAIHPDRRWVGWGKKLLEAVLDADQRAERPVAIWAHGNLPGALVLASRHELRLVRELLYLTVDLTGDRPGSGVASMPEGVTVATFRPGTRDGADWLELNAATFANHPEQGRLTAGDLQARMAQPWFDPTLFWLARDADGELAAAIWVKPGEGSAEIYVMGVRPRAQGRRLGTLLTKVAMAEVRRRGFASMDLYVEGDNIPARATYESQGFRTAQTHVQYSR